MKAYHKGVLILVILGLILLTACQRKPEAALQQDERPVGETKTITDHAGHTVAIPLEPKRIASLHTMSTTHMLWDLEAPLIGTATRTLKEENRPYIRSVEEVFNVKFQDTGLFDYGKKGGDIEQIKLSKPDLIVGMHEHMSNYENLSEIAPTIIIDQGTHDMYEVHRDLASWVARADVFAAKERAYRERLANVRAQFSKDPNIQTFAYALPLEGKAMFEARKHYGALTKVAYDLGFQVLPFIAEQFPGQDDVGGKISAEYLGEIQSDWLFATYNNQRGQTMETIYSGFDEIAPGWKDFVPAYAKDQIVVFPRESSRPMSFQVINMVLDEFAKVAK